MSWEERRSMKGRFCQAAILLWVVTVGAVAWLFVHGWTTAGADQRTAVVLGPSERDQILGEMRLLLKAVHHVIDGLGAPDPDRQAMADAARAAGVGMAADVNPAVMAKLPLAFKQMGMSIHRDMDALADGILQQETAPHILRRLSSMTARCTTCHDLYRLVGRP